ncbi:MAG TPA: Fic family protein [Bacillota bacterium]|nr:Fic family protein [Bacillota bacterium]
MYREIKKKKLILDNRKPFRKETARLIAEINRLDWIYSSMQLDGGNLKKEAVGRIINGDFLTDISINEHSIISNYKGVIDLAYDMAEMDYYLNEKYMFKLYKILTGETEAEYRKSNPVLRMIAYNPPHFKEIEEQMELMFNWLHSNLYQTNPIEKAAYLHNKLIEIYPYQTSSEAMARIAAQYHLIRNGFPPIQWNISEQEYYDAIRIYLKNEDIQPIYDVLERGVFNKLEIMMQLTAES